MDHQQNAVWSSALWTQHRSRARFPWLHSRTGDKAIRNWRLASVCSIATILDKSPKDSNAVFLIFCNFWLPSKHCNLLKNIFQFSLPTPYTKLKLKKILDTHVQPCLCVCVGGGLGMCDLKRATQMQMECPRLVHDWKYERCNLKIACLLEILPYLKRWDTPYPHSNVR